jgi:hypothetical protein
MEVELAKLENIKNFVHQYKICKTCKKLILSSDDQTIKKNKDQDKYDRVFLGICVDCKSTHDNLLLTQKNNKRYSLMKNYLSGDFHKSRKRNIIPKNLDNDIIYDNLDSDVISDNLDSDIISDNLDSDVISKNIGDDLVEKIINLQSKNKKSFSKKSKNLSNVI